MKNAWFLILGVPFALSAQAKSPPSDSCRITETKGHQTEVYNQPMAADSGGAASQFKLKLFPDVSAEIDRMPDGSGTTYFGAVESKVKIPGCETNGECELGEAEGNTMLRLTVKFDNSIDHSVEIYCPSP